MSEARPNLQQLHKKSLSSLCAHYGVIEEDLNKEISDLHLEEIARETCTCWRSLPPHLGIETNLVKDIERDFSKEVDRRRELFDQWKQRRGAEATYRNLVKALQYLKERRDAGHVCKLLRQTVSSPETSLNISSGAPSPPKSSTCTCSDDSESSKLEDLEQQLDLELQHITNRYASYVHCIRKSIKEKGITAQDLCAYLMNLRAFKPKNRKKMPGLMSAMRDELERAKTTDKIFIILSDKCASFLNFEIFQSMIDDYEIDKNQERLNYPQHLREYAEKHKLSEFIDMNPLLKKLDDNAKKIKLKLDIELTCSLAKLNDLRKHLANILGIRKSALRIVDIKQGCVEVTFQIPAPVAEAIFTSDKIFTSQEVNDFQELSVISLKIDEHSFEFKEESNPLQEDEACASKPRKRDITQYSPTTQDDAAHSITSPELQSTPASIQSDTEQALSTSSQGIMLPGCYRRRILPLAIEVKIVCICGSHRLEERMKILRNYSVKEVKEYIQTQLSTEGILYYEEENIEVKLDMYRIGKYGETKIGMLGIRNGDTLELRRCKNLREPLKNVNLVIEPSGKTITVRLPPSCTVHHLKSVIECEIIIYPGHQCIKKNGQVLEDTQKCTREEIGTLTIFDMCLAGPKFNFQDKHEESPDPGQGRSESLKSSSATAAEQSQPQKETA